MDIDDAVPLYDDLFDVTILIVDDGNHHPVRPGRATLLGDSGATSRLPDRAGGIGVAERLWSQGRFIYDEVGGFGVLLLIFGKDWGTREQRGRSMERFMAEVAPRLAALDPDKPSAIRAAE